MENNNGQIIQVSPHYFKLIGIRYRGENYLKLNGFPDTSSFKNGTFYFKPSYSNIEYAIKNFPDIEWIGEAKEKLEEMALFKIEEAKKQLVKDSHITESIDKKNVVPGPGYLSKTKPFDHQALAWNISHNLKEFGIFFEQGCGKTKVIIDTARYLFDVNEIDTLIVIAPNGVHDNWIDDELSTHMHGSYAAMAWRSQFKKSKKELWNKLKQVKDILKVFAFNIETFTSEKNRKELFDILSNNKCMLVIDESQKIKNPSAKRTKFLVKVGELARYKRILTGTPITRGAEDFYSQLKFLNPNIIGISSYSGFKNRYCVMGGFEFRQIIGYNNLEELQKKIQNHSMRVLKKDCLDLPEKLYQFAPFDLTDEQLKMIKQIKDEGVAELKDLSGNNRAVILEYVISRLMKIQQVSRGYYYDTENNNVIEIVPFDKNPAIKKLKELLAGIEGKVIIWTWFKQDVKLVTKALPPDSYLLYDGSIDQETKRENKKLFQHGKDHKYMIINPKSGATGLTLTAAEHNIYFTDSYDLELRLQGEDRTHRIGTVNNVNYINLVANKTNDKKIINALRKKKTISDIVLNDPASMFLMEE